MKQYIDPYENKEEAGGRSSFSYLPAAVMLLLLLIFAAGAILVKSAGMNTGQTDTAIQGGQAAQTEPQVQNGQDELNETAERIVEELKAREAALTDREKAVTEGEAAIKALAGVRTEMIRELSGKLAELKLPVEINEVTGSVRFTEAVLFDVDQDVINVEGQQYLKAFVPVYLSVLLSDQYEKYLDQIIIEGHADNGGTYRYNLELSQKRADSVVNFILAQNLASLPGGKAAEKYLTVGARSFNVPVLVDGVPDRGKSRRVEFVFRLKDEETLKQIQDLYKGAR